MKKFLTLLGIFAILCVSVTGALAVIPHGHGDDLDHSKHAACPVFQAGILSAGFILATAGFAALLDKAARHISIEPSFFFFTRSTYASLRAPPVSA
jgi:hypothetical protein